MRRVLRWSIALAIVLVVPGLAVNAFLSSPLADLVMNSHPELVQIHYTRATSPWPFHVRLENFQLSVQDPSLQLSATADQVEADLYPWTLLRHRFYATHVRGKGVTFRLRSRTSPGDGVPVDELPTIPGYDHPERDGSTFPPIDQLISVELRDLDVTDLREVWIERVHVEGTFDLTGGFLFRPFQSIEVGPSHFSRGLGQVLLGKEPLATIDALTLSGELGEVPLGEQASGSFLDAVNASVNLEAQLVDARALNAYLRGVPKVHVDEGAGKLSLTATVNRGVLAGGSKAALDTERVVVHLPYFEVLGRASLRLEVKDHESWVNLHVPHFALLQHSDGKQVLEGAHFRLLAGGSDALEHLTETRLELQLEDAHADDLSFLNAFIPPGTGVRVLGGAGAVSGKLAIASNRRGHGALDIDGQALKVQNRAATLTGHAKIHGAVTALDLDSGEMNLSGSSLSLEDVSVQAGQTAFKDFWLTLTADPCLLSPKQPSWATNLVLEFQNLAPVVAIAAANLSLPEVLAPLVDEPGVKATAALTVRKDTVDLEHLRLDSPRIHAQAEVRLLDEKGGTSKNPKLEPWGAALVKVRNLGLGLELQGPKTVPQLFEPERWYGTWKQSHATPDAGRN